MDSPMEKDTSLLESRLMSTGVSESPKLTVSLIFQTDNTYRFATSSARFLWVSLASNLIELEDMDKDK
ncbi:hypothetical protein KL919_003875 [Ogataea angusta]|nr:hypothetical protein KL919_003875 [Ogataea angusta]KAG7857868.1 hypothetical protein KL939_003124 [Ogataea angusta]